jgi:DNA-binding NtrC family response regulator
LATRTKVIFVVDDDVDQAEALAEALSMDDVRVRAFSDPIRALAALNADGADLHVADLAMPWIDGVDVIASARLRKPDVQVILVSGFDQAAEIAKTRGQPFFAKPVDPIALRAAAREALRSL